MKMIDDYELPDSDPIVFEDAPNSEGQKLVREVWDMLKYLDHKADRIGEICRLDKADIDSLRYSNQQLDIAENILGSMRNQIERPILEEDE
jgi:hypothetical protein